MPNRNDARILIVDDDDYNRSILASWLRRLGYARVSAVADGIAALEALEAEPFDVVLLDVEMPRLGGLEVLDRLRAEQRLEQSPVIMISGSTELDTAVRCIELGAEDYLPKPFNPTLLRTRLGSVLEKKRLRDSLRREL